MYVATINVPGYLPMDDEPPVFDTAREAWEYLRDEYRASADDAEGVNYSAAVNGQLTLNPDEEGTVYVPTPGHDGEHDLGLAYSVTEVDAGESVLDAPWWRSLDWSGE